MKAEKIGDQFKGHDIFELTYTRTGLRVIITGVTQPKDELSYLEVFFSSVAGFRCLDEGDLIAYWESKQFAPDHCCFRIKEGGWLDQEATGILSVSEGTGDYIEYFLSTDDYCISILAPSPPEFRIYSDPYPLTNK